VQDLADSLILLRTLRAVLALLSTGAGYTEALDGPAGATLARCAGAIDFARLEADMTTSCAKARAWYDRLVTRPARRLARASQQTSAETAG
jgi:hypothetical protein